MLFHMDKLRWDSMRSVGFECHLMPTGKYGISEYVFGALGGFADMVYSFDTQEMQPNAPSIPTFAVYNPAAWNAFRQAFTTYVKHIVVLEKGPPNSAEDKVLDTYTMENMTFSTSGLPLLPQPVKNEFGTETKKIQQGIIRTYLTKQYSDCSQYFVC